MCRISKSCLLHTYFPDESKASKTKYKNSQGMPINHEGKQTQVSMASRQRITYICHRIACNPFRHQKVIHGKAKLNLLFTALPCWKDIGQQYNWALLLAAIPCQKGSAPCAQNSNFLSRKVAVARPTECAGSSVPLQFLDNELSSSSLFCCLLSSCGHFFASSNKHQGSLGYQNWL